MPRTTIFEWTFEPKDFFEDPLALSDGACSVVSTPGVVEARISPEGAGETKFARQSMHEFVLNHFRGHQLVSRRRYKLSEPRHVEIDESGKRHAFLYPESATFTFSVQPADFVVRASDGSIISDSRAERIARKRDLSAMIQSRIGVDPILRRILSSYELSISDDANELIHLYEIRDALQVRYGTSEKARKALAITKSDWKKLGDLANKHPIKQGRHRGQHLVLRDATEQELSTARSIAVSLIEAYLHHASA